ncbi:MULTISPECIES: Stk1 family PASTA domain-containing Ser/Thr kinase [unclassified Corynebacterium]|uniref:Stk1 family PASTA domain-containing Ser/Thr kinase n=1 Tax=unclassified Corynebacterium TaxID=2624378 RepID=UPI002168E127|nr:MULTISPECIES: Stk1 family PASTA domain-containing Ser/Thr kinase [unclassified Corynebacterium]MCS4492204.1 Stk1 family PASTA domain-containing Ser/Thr kinase [Corynebacterium sp. ES2715-CONJ3]MCS4532314.1 Stk1 family PASTA domain-containing Ser/Thr kinase [Corynebacterium sp. ES2730-CONJ]
MTRMIAHRYELGPVIGTGGMSEVYQAMDTLLGREVAIKILRADLARNENSRERFRKEAQNAGRLNHPAIVAVYDTGEIMRHDISTPYIVMELVNGRNLRDIIKETGPLSPEEAATTLIPVCEALQASHDAGIIHRDIKPANVMITNTGVVKIMDFGIARALDDVNADMTQTSAVIGTAQYLSPEQARGKAVDGRADIYALGCVLYNILTDRPPFAGENALEVAVQHVQDEPQPPSDFIPDLTPTEALNVNAVVLTAMAKHPGDRYQTAAEMAADLKRLESNAVTMAARNYVEPASAEHTTVQPVASVGKHRHPSEVIAATPPQRGGNLVWKILIGLLLILSLGIVGTFTYTYLSGSTSPIGGRSSLSELQDYALVPSDQAMESLIAQGFEVTLSEEASPTVKQGLVIRSNPAAGSAIQKGTTVTLIVSSGKEVTEVPDLKNKKTAEANRILQKAGLELDSVVREDTSETVPEGEIIEQSPSAGSRVSKGSKVTITISTGIEQQRVPVVTGMKWEQAEGNLTSLGFEPIVQVVDGVEPDGTVVFVAGEGSKVDSNSRIEIRISNGQLFTMPDVTGGSVASAKRALEAAGWRGGDDQLVIAPPVKTTSLIDGGRVANQQQAAGTKIRKDSVITLALWEFDIAAIAP